MSQQLVHPLIARCLRWSWVFVMLLLGLSGVYPHNPGWMPLFDLAGGMKWARTIHFVGMYLVLFLFTVMVHIYMGAISGWSTVKSMITGRLE